MGLLTALILLFATLFAVLYYSKKGLKYCIKRFFGPSGWDWTKKSFFILASVFLIFGSIRRLYYFHDDMIYGDQKLLNPSYSSQIAVETYLMSQQNLIDLFEGKPPNPDKSPFPDNWLQFEYYNDPANPRYYLVFRLKNLGDQSAWGMLDLFVDNEKIRSFEVPPLPPNMSDFEIMAIKAAQKDKNEMSNNRNYPTISANWSLLFTQKGELHE